MTDTTNRPTLPTFALDYGAGTFTNTLTGEQTLQITGVLLGHRQDRVLWPTIGELPRLPLCVNGSEFGPCLCAWADWGKDGSPPECSEELSVLLWQDDGAQVVTLTARRSQVRVLDQYLGMKATLGGLLHDQRITLGMKPGGEGLHRLTLLPGEGLEQVAQGRMAGVAERVQASGLWEGL